MYVINRIIEYGMKNKVGLNNVEGFVRQVLGWREFSRYTYIYIYKEMTTENYFQANVPITKKYYDGTTGLSVLDDTIKKAFKNCKKSMNNMNQIGGGINILKLQLENLNKEIENLNKFLS